MRFRLALALSVSIILIGFASWTRLTPAKTIPSLVAIEQVATTEEDYQEILNDFLEPKTATSTPSNVPLSNTDLLGRELIMDYINLAKSGQATDETVIALAENHVGNLPALNNVSRLSYSDIKAVTNTKANFQNYANEITKIHKAYAQSINSVGAGENNLNNLNPALYSFAGMLSSVYNDTASKLKNLPVPTSLAQTHLQLINTYLASAAAMKALSETEKDSATAFAGLVMVNDNLQKEERLLNEISLILTSNGI